MPTRALSNAMTVFPRLECRSASISFASLLRRTAPYFCLVVAVIAGDNRLFAQTTITLSEPTQGQTFAHGATISSIKGTVSQTGQSLSVKVKVTNKFTYNNVMYTYTQEFTTATNPADGKFNTSSSLQLYGLGGSATWKVEVWLEDDPTVKDDNDGSVSPP